MSHEAFTIERVSRKAIKNAPYNPRMIEPAAKKALQAVIERVGLLGPITVNRLTGNIVGGHQRLACLDALEGNDVYSLDVAYVELDQKTEMEQNLFLNNEFSRGSWDLPMLKTLLSEVNYEHAGFNSVELKELLAVPQLDEVIAPAAVEMTRAEHQVEELAEQAVAAAAPSRRRSTKKKGVSECIVVFESRPILEAFLAKIGMDHQTKFIQAERLIMTLRAARGIKTETPAKAPEDSPF